MATAYPVKFEPIDTARIELTEDCELRYWTSRFQCTSNELLSALKAVGVSALAVEAHLAMQKWPAAGGRPVLSVGLGNQRGWGQYAPMLPVTGSTIPVM